MSKANLIIVDDFGNESEPFEVDNFEIANEEKRAGEELVRQNKIALFKIAKAAKKINDFIWRNQKPPKNTKQQPHYQKFNTRLWRR